MLRTYNCGIGLILMVAPKAVETVTASLRASGESPLVLGEALLEPTRIYVKPLLALLRDGAPVKALAHVTGGGFPDNLPRVLPETLSVALDLDAITVPPVFGWLGREGGVAEAEMLRTFNCGIGMAAVVPAAEADAVIAALAEAGETATRIGTLVPRGDGERVTTSGALAL